jgi:hypothetical protein
MKKLFTFLTLLLCAVAGAWAEDVTIFSANAIATSDQKFPNGTTEITSAQATITGGKMYAISGQTDDKVLIAKTGYFSHTNNNTYFKIELNTALAKGDIITAKYTGGDKNGDPKGIVVSTTDTNGGSIPNTACTATSTSTTAMGSTLSYTVTSDDEYVGQSALYVYRAVGSTQYFDEFVVTRSVSDRTNVTLTYSAATANANLGEAFTAPTLTVDPTAAASEVKFSSSKATVATIDAGGNVTILAAGETTITATISGSETYKDASASYKLTVVDPNAKTVTATFPFNTGKEGQVATVNAENVFSVTSVAVADMTYNGVGSDQGITGTKMQPVSKASDNKSQYVKFTVTPKKGITFTPTKISFDAMRWGTDGSNKLHYYAESGTTSIELGNVNPNRNGKGEGWSHYEHSISDINATSDAPFSLACYVYGLATDKQISFANVVIEGEYSGEAQDETMYTITTSVTPDGAGSVNQNPAGASLTEGTAIEFSATANTGYKFLNKWVVNGTEVSGATYSVASLSENLEVVAQFQKLFAVSYDAGEGDKGTTNAILTTEYTEGTYTTPAANFYISKPGYTVTGWTDGTNEYGFGEELTLTGDITLSPVFTANTKTIADTGDDNVTITYGFNNTAGDPVINLENSTGYYVKKATFSGEAIDVAIFIDNRDNAGIDGKRGKTNNVGRANAQINTGAKFTIPAVNGMKVSVGVADGSMEGTTINGEAFTDTYTYTGNGESIDIIFTSDKLYISNVKVTYPSTTTSVSGTITACGYNTFSSKHDLDLSTITGGTAYIADRVDADESKVVLVPCTGKVPAGTGLMIAGTAGEEFTIATTTDAPAVSSNLLVGMPEGGIVSTATSGYNYVFGWTDATNPGFYLVDTDLPELPAGKAYLHTDATLSSNASSRLIIAIGDETTGISTVNTEKTTNSIFNLNGQRVAQPQKGIVIMNGKKTIIK